MNRSNLRDAKVIEVITTTTCVGRGTKDDPAREIIQYWSLKGVLLATVDPLELLR